MKARIFGRLSLLPGLFLLLALIGGLAASAQGPEQTEGPRAMSYQGPDRAPGTLRAAASGALTAEGSDAPTADLGEPGLSFRYVETLGETEVPYFADTTHIYRPWGLFMDGGDNLYVVDEQGYRLLRYNSVGSNTLAIGKAGVCYTDDYVFCIPKDVALDDNGNIWVADGNRVIEYNASGTYLQQRPATDPWVSGNDNERFEYVNGIAFDSSGRMYVADTGNHRVQVYSFSGGTPVYSTTIGVTDAPGNDNGHFDSPYRVEVDSSNRLYVLDRGNQRVQRCVYTGDWTCTTFDNGLNDPEGLSLDNGDNVYIADKDPGRIRKCSSLGACTDLVVGGNWLRDLAVDSAGNIYGSAAYENHIQRFDSGGEWLGVFVGAPLIPYLTDNYHYNHARVAIDGDDNILIVEEGGHRLVKLDSNGAFQWSVGTPGRHGSANDRFEFPHGVAADANGYVYVADGNNRVQIYDPNGTYYATLGTGWGIGDYEFGWATGVAVGVNGYIYVSDAENHRVQIYDSNRQFLGRIGVTGDCGSDNDHLCWPFGVAVDSLGSVYIADVGNCRVQKFNSSWVYEMTFGKTGSCGDSLLEVSPEDVAVDKQGQVYVCGWDNRVQVFDSDGNYLTTIGGAWGSNTSQFRVAAGVDVDSHGNVYVADFQNARIQKFAPGVPGWRQVNINGFGDRWAEWVTALEVFDGQLYAASANWGSGARIWRTSNGNAWTVVTEPGFGSAYTSTNPVVPDMIVFGGQLYAGTGWDGAAGQVWRSSDGSAWQPVTTDGFGDNNNWAVSNLAIFDDMLYAGTANDDGAQIWRSSSGDDGSWTKVATDGLGSTDANQVTGLAVFQGALHAAIETKQGGDAQVWRTTNGTDWVAVVADGFGDSDNIQTGGFAEFDGHLYLGTYNDTTGAQIWKSDNGTTWTEVMVDGFGDLDNIAAQCLFVFRDELYAVTANEVGGMEVWRSGDGTTWAQVSPDGFGDSNNFAPLWNSGVAVYRNRLYVGTFNWANGGEVWTMLDKVYLPLVMRNH